MTSDCGSPRPVEAPPDSLTGGGPVDRGARCVAPPVPANIVDRWRRTGTLRAVDLRCLLLSVDPSNAHPVAAAVALLRLAAAG